ncbi:photoactive yellow protein [Massilia sp. IC2-477]|uniref:photoactive yellow protein n=1 Tax=unclassified Massilia TaxID=2609279 RepID=UPI001D0FCE96|nr:MULTISPECIES: photoactive yellow protein [unclassified Massilia]MCC2958595.1 photoactive yellow protein [Massilia sp. IC2-477]MCC2974783.1 photoactive yellow protein [Massilia sp. IC2-476]
MSTLNIIAFGKDDIENKLSSMSAGQIDELAFGAIQLDAQGKIMRYNEAEAQITGRQASAVIGSNFFRDVAPCTNTPRFKGIFDAGVRTGTLNTMFEYVFDYKMNPTKVKIHMKKAISDGTYWIFVKRL